MSDGDRPDRSVGAWIMDRCPGSLAVLGDPALGAALAREGADVVEVDRAPGSVVIVHRGAPEPLGDHLDDVPAETALCCVVSLGRAAGGPHGTSLSDVLTVIGDRRDITGAEVVGGRLCVTSTPGAPARPFDRLALADALLRSSLPPEAAEELEAAQVARVRSEAELRRESRRRELQRMREMEEWVKASRTFRIGSALAESSRRPGDLAKLPKNLWSLYRAGSARVQNPYEAVELELPPPRRPIRALSILDEFTETCFRPELDLTRLSKQRWQKQLRAGTDLLFVESAWRGNDKAWNYALNKYDAQDPNVLARVLEECRSLGIPSVFWNKEDPVNYEVFINAARHFDWVFTTAAEAVPRYDEEMGGSRAQALPFAAQPAVHNPIGRRIEVLPRVCFAGSWRGDKYAERGNDFVTLLDPPMQAGVLDIIDRYADHPDADRLGFPPPYKTAVIGSLPYPRMLQAYKRYAAFLNVNSVTDSTTMFSRRVFELLACGTPVISTPAVGLEEMLGDTVLITSSPAQTRNYVDQMVHDETARDHLGQRGMRLVMNEHTYSDRTDRILERIGLPALGRIQPGCTVVCVSNRPDRLAHALENFDRQSYGGKHLLFVTNSGAFDIDELDKRIASIPRARWIAADPDLTLGECLNLAIDQLDTAFVAKMDDDDLYGDDYLADLMTAFLYSEADIVGKGGYYCHVAGRDETWLRGAYREFKYGEYVAGGTIVASVEAIDDLRFQAVPRGTDTRFLKDAAAAGLRIFSADRFNFVQMRGADRTSHTWQIDEEHYLRNARRVGSGLVRDAVFV